MSEVDPGRLISSFLAPVAGSGICEYDLTEGVVPEDSLLNCAGISTYVAVKGGDQSVQLMVAVRETGSDQVEAIAFTKEGDTRYKLIDKVMDRIRDERRARITRYEVSPLSGLAQAMVDRRRPELIYS